MPESPEPFYPARRRGPKLYKHAFTREGEDERIFNIQCQDCEWGISKSDSRSAALTHHKKTGHSVRVEIIRVVYYETPERIDDGYREKIRIAKEKKERADQVASEILSLIPGAGRFG